jgi:hypothetical protein
MNKEIRVIDPIKNIIQITTLDERWYQVGTEFYPSVSWIAGQYPKGVQFYKWLASKGWNEAEEIKTSAGERGSNVHNAIDKLNKGETIDCTMYSLDEIVAIQSYVNWYNTVNPTILSSELFVYSHKHKYAGTLDIVAEIGSQLYIVDIKTAKSIWKEYELQLSAYKRAYQELYNPGELKIAILQVGYNMNKKKYKFTELDDKFDLFLSARKIWDEENPATKPKQFTLPTFLKLNQ